MNKFVIDLEQMSQKKIKAFFDERRKTTETLEKQIQDLKIASEELEKKSSHLKSALEEAEYASAKGVGGNRLLTEGKKILNKKKEQLNENKRKMAAQEAHQRQIKAAAHHLLEVMALVRHPNESSGDQTAAAPPEDEVNVESSTRDILKWCREKCHQIKQLNDEEDQDYAALVNKREFVNIIQRTESNFDMDQVQSDQIHRIRPLEFQHKRQPKENKGDIQTRVLDRQQVKMQAQKAYQLSLQKQKKPNQ